MSLHPILALDRVVEEFKDYLRTEFRAKDPGLRASLETELDRPGFLAQEPFFQAHRPFKSGKKWKELPLEERLPSWFETTPFSCCRKTRILPILDSRASLMEPCGASEARSRKVGMKVLWPAKP